MSQSPYTPRQQAFIAALAIPFVENTSTEVFNPSIPLVNQGHLVPDWVEMGVITEESSNLDKQALILKGVDACVAAFESADPSSREEAVFDALHKWAENDLRDSDFKADEKYHYVAYALKDACREQTPVALAVEALTTEEWLGSGTMVITDIHKMIEQIEAVLPVLKEHQFDSVQVATRGYSIETYPDDEVRLYGERLHVSKHGSYVENMFKNSSGSYESPHLSLTELKKLAEYATKEGLVFIDNIDRKVVDNLIQATNNFEVTVGTDPLGSNKSSNQAPSMG